MNHENDAPLKQSVQTHLNSFELSQGQLNALYNLESVHKEQQLNKDKKGYNNIYKSKIGLAICACVCLMAIGLFQTKILPQGLHSDQVLYEIAQEVSRNHLKFKPLEVEHSGLVHVANYFNKLDFNPIVSTRVSALKNELIGGRYCSIKGNIAAQLRMKNGQGQTYTLFESKYNADDFSMLPSQDAPAEYFVDGQSVQLWVEQGVVMALVKPIMN